MEPNNTDPCMESLEDRYKSLLPQYLTFVPFIVYFARATIPLWLLLGVPGSLLSLIVWSSKPMRCSSSVYLCALAVLDVTFLLCQQLPYHIHTYYDINVMDNPVMCQASPVFNMWLQYLSPMLTLGFTIERYISICHPFRRQQLCTVRRAIIVVACMTVASLSLGLVQLHFYEYSYIKKTCSEDIRIFNQTTLEHRFYSGWSKLTEVLFFAIAPLMILAFNILVLVQARKVISSQATNGEQEKAAKSAATTATLLTVSFYQIGAVLPVTILLIVGLAIIAEEDPRLPCGISDEAALQQLASGQWPTVRSYLAYLTVSRTIDCLAVSHYAMKFVIYLVTGRRFRHQLISMCAIGRGRPARWSPLADQIQRSTSDQRRRRREQRCRRPRGDSEESATGQEKLMMTAAASS